MITLLFCAIALIGLVYALPQDSGNSVNFDYPATTIANSTNADFLRGLTPQQVADLFVEQDPNYFSNPNGYISSYVETDPLSARYNFGSNNFNGSGNFTTLGGIGIGQTATNKLTIRQNGATAIPFNIINSNAGALRYSELMFSYPGDLATAGIRGYATDLSSNLKSQLRFYTSTSGGTKTERMTIDDAGNVGIGKTDPSYLLDVNAGAGTSGIRVDGNRPIIIRADGTIEWRGASVGGWINSYDFKTNDSVSLTQFGVYGTNPSTLGYFYIGPAYDNTWLIIKPSGYIGVNITNPITPLDVNGSATIRGNLNTTSLTVNNTAGITGNYSVGPCWQKITGGIVTATNCTAL